MACKLIHGLNGAMGSLKMMEQLFMNAQNDKVKLILGIL